MTIGSLENICGASDIDFRGYHGPFVVATQDVRPKGVSQPLGHRAVLRAVLRRCHVEAGCLLG